MWSKVKHKTSARELHDCMCCFKKSKIWSFLHGVCSWLENIVIKGNTLELVNWKVNCVGLPSFTFSLLRQYPMSESLDYATSSTKRVGRQHMTPCHLRSPTLWMGGTLPVKRACGLPIFSTTLIAMLLTFPFFWEFILVVPSRTAYADVILLSVHKFFLSLYFPHPLSVPSLSWPSALHYTQLPAINISFLVALCWN